MNTSPFAAGQPLVPGTPQGSWIAGSGEGSTGVSQPFLRKAAHDMRGPLNTIILNLELLRESLSRESHEEQRPRQERYLAVIGSEVQRMSAMLDSFFGQLGTLDEAGQTYDLRETLSSFVTMLAPYCRRKRVELRLELPEQACPVRANRDLVQDALVGLLLHAVEAMPGGGEVDLSLRVSDTSGIVSIAGPRFGGKPLPQSSAVQRLTEQSGASVRMSPESRRDVIEIELPLETTSS